MLPVMPVLARLRHLPLDVWWKRSPAHSFSKTFVYVGVVVRLVVRENENALPFERRTEKFSTHHGRPAGVACSFQVREDLVSGDIFEVRNVLNEDPTGSEFSDDSCVFVPETAPPVESALLAPGSDAEVLAGEAAADEIDWLEVVLADAFDVEESWDTGPPFSEDFIAKGVDFYLKSSFEACPLQTEVDSAYAREKAAVGQRHAV